MLQQKIEWYRTKRGGIKESVEETEEAKQLDKATQDREFVLLQNHKSGMRKELSYEDLETE